MEIHDRAGFMPARRALMSGAITLLATPWAALAHQDALVGAIQDAVGDVAPIDHGMLLRVPAVAENGGQVPITVLVDSPQTAEQHVVAIHVFATQNPTPGIASFHLTPHVARAEVQTRIRLAEAQRVVVLARFNDGSLRRAVAEVRVGAGGCLT
jgi:sulfur-oxidizing protein SoxY